MAILNFSPNLPEQGKIKIGGKGAERQSKSGNTYRMPEKWDHFELTTLERDNNGDFVIDEEMTEKVAFEKNKDGKPTMLGPCILPFNEIELNFYTAFAYYTQSQLICRGNGEKALRCDYEGEDIKEEEIECNPKTCEFAKEKKCKPNGILSVIFPDADRIGGVYKFRTTSWNSVISILSQLQMFFGMTRGRISGIKFYLKLNQGTATVKGKKVTIYFVTLEYQGSYEMLIEDAKKTLIGTPLIQEAQLAKRMMLENSRQMNEDTEEFYSEEAPILIEEEEFNGEPEGMMAQERPEPPAEEKPKRKTGKQKKKEAIEILDRTKGKYLIALTKHKDMLSVKDLVESVNPEAKSPNDLALPEILELNQKMELEIFQHEQVADAEKEVKKPKSDEEINEQFDNMF